MTNMKPQDLALLVKCAEDPTWAADEIDRLLGEVENWKISATCAADEVKTLNEEADELGVQIDRLTAELAASNAKLSECRDFIAMIANEPQLWHAFGKQAEALLETIS